MQIGDTSNIIKPPETPLLFFSNAKPVPPEWINFTRNGLLVLALLQIICAGGLIFGWSSLQPILIREGFFAEPCLSKNVTNPSVEQLMEAAGCDKQTEALGDVFIVAVNTNHAAQLFIGYFLDKRGPKNTIVLSFLVTTVAIVLLGYRQLWVAIMLIAVGSPGIGNSMYHATSMITGAVGLSLGIFTIFSLLYAEGKGASLLSICIGYSAVTFLMALTSAVVWPDTPFPQFVPKKNQSKLSDSEEHIAKESGKESTTKTERTVPDLEERLLDAETGISGSGSTRRSFLSVIVGSWVSLPSATKKKGQLINAEDDNTFYNLPLHKQLMTSRFVIFIVFFSVQNTLSNYYIETVTEQVQTIECQHGIDSCTAANLEKVGSFTLIFNIVIVAGALITPVFGIVIDRFGLPACGFLSCALSLVYTMCLFLASTDLQIISFVAYALWQGSLYTFAFAYMGRTFGFANFGMVVGVTYLVCSAVGFLMLLLVRLASPNKPYSTSCESSISCWLSLGYHMPNTVQTVLLAVSFLFPCFVATRKRVTEAESEVDDDHLRHVCALVSEGSRTTSTLIN